YHDDVSSSHSSSRHLHSTSYTIISHQPPATWQLPIGQPPVTWHLRQHRSTTVNADGHRSTPSVNDGVRRSTVAVNDGSRWRTALTAAGPPLTTIGPPVNGGWWVGQRSDLGRVHVESGSGLGRVRHVACHVSATCAHVSAMCAHVASTWMLTWRMGHIWESNPVPLVWILRKNQENHCARQWSHLYYSIFII
nr:hypothetical protein [Tanacetum cinerariifolium]